MEIKLKYLNQYPDARGDLKIYYRRKRTLKGIEITARPPGSPEFMRQYYAAQEKHELELGLGPEVVTVNRSLAWLWEQYKQSDKWKNYAPDTATRKEQRFDKYAPRFGHLPIDLLDRVGVRKIRDERRHAPHAANTRLKDLSAMFNWAIAEGIVKDNPVRGVSKVPVKAKPDGSTGHRTWTEAEIDHFLEFYPLGTREHLAMNIFIYTGARRSDACRLGPGMVEDGTLTFVERKNQYKVNAAGETNPKIAVLPILPPLQESIDAYQNATKVIGMTWLIQRHGQPFSPDGLSHWFIEKTHAAGLPKGLVPHGIRKAGAVICANAGATAWQLMAIFGWTNIRTAQKYTQAAEKKKLAADGLEKLKVTREKITE